MPRKKPKKKPKEAVAPEEAKGTPVVLVPGAFQMRFSPRNVFLLNEVESGEARLGGDHASWNVLIHGPTGAGKDVLATYVAAHCLRRELVRVSCATLQESVAESQLFGVGERFATGVDKRDGVVAAAEGKTLFLNEIDKAPPSVQGKLLEFLVRRTYTRLGEESKPLIVRDCVVLADTNKPLAELAPELVRRFGHEWSVPPLSERLDEIPGWVAFFFAEAGIRSVEEAFLLECMYMPWAANLGGLRKAVSRWIALWRTMGYGIPPSYMCLRRLRQDLDRLADEAGNVAKRMTTRIAEEGLAGFAAETMNELEKKLGPEAAASVRPMWDELKRKMTEMKGIIPLRVSVNRLDLREERSRFVDEATKWMNCRELADAVSRMAGSVSVPDFRIALGDEWQKRIATLEALYRCTEQDRHWIAGLRPADEIKKLAGEAPRVAAPPLPQATAGQPPRTMERLIPINMDQPFPKAEAEFRRSYWRYWREYMQRKKLKPTHIEGKTGVTERTVRENIKRLDDERTS